MNKRNRKSATARCRGSSPRRCSRPRAAVTTTTAAAAPPTTAAERWWHGERRRAAASRSPVPGFDGTTIRLGVVTPQTGPVQIIGNPLTNGNRVYFDS